MSTTETQQDNPPATDPRRDPGDRFITASWPVGPPSESGEQKRATLKVMYHKGTGYTAALATMHETIEPERVTQRMNLISRHRDVRIHARAAERFNRRVFEDFYNTALTELRAQFDSGDDAVTTYFDPDSPVIDFA